MPAITLHERPSRHSLDSRYDVRLHGQHFDELYFNLRGYRGYLPTPEGRKLDIGEQGITAYRREIARLNREFAKLPSGRS